MHNFSSLFILLLLHSSSHKPLHVSSVITLIIRRRSEERRVGKECFSLYGGHHKVALTREMEYNMQISHKTDVQISDTLQYVKTMYKHGSDNISFGKQESLGNRGVDII
jgi:hypothetical protein